MSNELEKEALSIMKAAYDDLYKELNKNFSVDQGLGIFKTDFDIDKHRILAGLECGLQMIQVSLNEYSALIDKESNNYDQEKIEYLAEKVMGWHKASNEGGYLPFTWRDKNGVLQATSDWNPLESISDAWMVLNALTAKGWYYKIATSSVDENPAVSLWNKELVPIGEYAETVALAICEVAIRATERNIK